LQKLLPWHLCNNMEVSKWRMAGLLGAARLAFGLALLIFPAPTLRFFYPRDDASRQVSLELGRALGLREVMLGLGILGAVLKDDSPKSWLLASAAADTADVSLTLTNSFSFSRRGRLVTYAAVPLTIPLEYYLAFKLDK
jgi:hypothetical protein